MNKQPVSYLQTDKRWKNKPYRVPGETSTIGSAGCGPTAAAMLIETITGKTFTPVDACAWSVEHGYKALKQGTYYAYFEPQFAAFGLSCKMLNWQKSYGKPDHPNHDKVASMLKEGYYAIALMGPGLWTTGGHFVVLWWQDDKVRINDPASTKSARLNGDIKTFRSQVNYYWMVDARSFNNATDNKEEERTMDKQTFEALMADWQKEHAQSVPDSTPADWEKEGVEWAVKNGLMVGDGTGNLMLHSPITRAQFCVMLKRYHEVFLTGGENK